MTLKIPLPDEARLTPEIVAMLGKLPPLNVFRMMANAPASFEPLVNFAMSILLRSEFDKRKRELAVLRVAHVTRSSYEWTQHVAVAKSVGVTDDEIAAIKVDGAVTRLDAEGNLLCRVADEISRDVRLSDEALAAIMDRYGVRQATELILCCSYFNMLSRFLESTRVELEPRPPLPSAQRPGNS
ncbi:carboxymuconolactone decarboxylase family protein [Candidatus Binatus sp.]|jgi:4-carboxymuconolactone decarboxylase|uniref:carboxymuconolactone decarboxylase family protein n=1 Tax=Candidatus Binatus sp. TaxID=2811406 RepID=UPI003BE512A3